MSYLLEMNGYIGCGEPAFMFIFSYHLVSIIVLYLHLYIFFSTTISTMRFQDAWTAAAVLSVATAHTTFLQLEIEGTTYAIGEGIRDPSYDGVSSHTMHELLRFQH
jgi:hypothetical protein